MDRSELGAWLRLLETPGLGLEAARRLLAAGGSPQAALELPAAAQRELLTPKQRQALSEMPALWPDLLDKTWAWIEANPAHSLLTLGEPDYPAALLATADPPLLLYLAGRRELLASPGLAIVGSRSPTPQGRDNAEHFAKALSQAGLTIISGLALGIDAAAHRGGLAAAASSIGVLGTGLDQIYPSRHRELAAEMLQHGLLISEYSLGTPALPPNFPRRNRIIAGLSLGCLVVEAALRSGSLITARLASEAGREVFAIPGSIHSPLSKGCHALIRQGAKLVETAQDVLEELPPQATAPAATSLVTASSEAGALPAGAPAQVLAQMGFDPVSLDSLMARGGWPAHELSAHLLELELEGHVERLPGQLFQRRAKA